MPAKTIQQLLKETQAISSVDLIVKTCIDLGYSNTKKTSGNKCLITTSEPLQTLVDIEEVFSTFNPEVSDGGIQIGQYTIGVEYK
jgi:hypothetical protein